MARLLLTSGGVTNPSIRAALLGLLGRPIEECTALCVPTAEWGHPMCSPYSAYSFVAGGGEHRSMTELGWKRLGLLELAALPSLDRERWEPWVREADVLLVDGGDAMYLAHWMRETGLSELVMSLPDLVWVGVSAGSMVMTPRVGEWFTQWRAPEIGDTTLGVVDFSIFPHLDMWPSNSMENAERWAAGIGGPSYAMDDQTAIVVDGDRTEVVSEGTWRFFPAPS